VPIVCTGNDFSTLYAPLIRDGRMEKVRIHLWPPTGQSAACWVKCGAPAVERLVRHSCPAHKVAGSSAAPTAVLLEPHPRGPHRRVHGHLPGTAFEPVFGCCALPPAARWPSVRSARPAGGLLPSNLKLSCMPPIRLPLPSLQHDNVNRADVETLVDAFPGQSIDFFGALRARVYDDKVRCAGGVKGGRDGRQC